MREIDIQSSKEGVAAGRDVGVTTPPCVGTLWLGTSSLKTGGSASLFQVSQLPLQESG